MTKLITWEMNRSFTPPDPAERMKMTLQLCDMVKKHIESGVIKTWGVNPGGQNGFGISEKDEKEILAMVSMYIPLVKFKVESMLSVEEVIATLKAMQPKT